MSNIKNINEGYAIAEVTDIITRACKVIYEVENYAQPELESIKKVSTYAYDELKNYFYQTLVGDKIDAQLEGKAELQKELEAVNKNNFKIINDKAAIESQLEMALEGNSMLKEYVDKKEGQIDKLLNILNRLDF